MKVALIGDIGFFGKYSMSENANVKEYFALAAKHLSQFDYVIGNLELPLLNEGQSIGMKSAYLKSACENVSLLKYLNINVVTLANNHIFDFGYQGVDSTVKLLEKHDIHHFGFNGKDLILADVKLALHGYCCYSTNPYGLNKGVNTLNLPQVEKKLKKYHKDGYLNLISVHAGLEHVNYPAYHDIQMAHQLRETCPYIYFGHHPHVLQGIELLERSLFAYSLGNFCFDDVYTEKSEQPLIKQTDNNKTSVIIELEITDGKLVSHSVTSLYMAEKQLEIGTIDIDETIKKYTALLSIDKKSYNKQRSKLLSKYINNRKSMRDFRWYIKRLNYQSIVILLRAKYNAWQHKRNVLRHIHANND
ncbi:MAG: CapA family protein [Colwellia sp.]